MDKREDIILIARKYLELVKASDFPMQIEKAYLFGSFAKGNPHKDSDIDIALVVNQWKGDYFDVVPPIWRLCENVDFRIEPHIIVPEDDYADFLPEIQRSGVELI
jgi:predicted nucleotidyltransferase